MGPARLPSVALGTPVMKPQVGGAEFMTGPQAGTLPGKGTGSADPLRVEPSAKPPPSVLGRDPAPAGWRWLASGVQSKGHGSRVQATRGHCVPSSQPPVTGDLRGGPSRPHPVPALGSGGPSEPSPGPSHGTDISPSPSLAQARTAPAALAPAAPEPTAPAGSVPTTCH